MLYRNGMRKVAAAAVVAASLSLVSVVVPGTANAAEPAFQLPFPCDQTWRGDNNNSSAHRSYEIDFNRGPEPDSDLGDKVVAAAKGTVRSASHQGSANRFGNLVKIEHSGGYFTYYAHLKTISVSVGQSVTRGQKIGTLGNTSKPGNNITPHLHYEVRLGSSGYPGNIQKATFNGSRFDYPEATITSRNC